MSDAGELVFDTAIGTCRVRWSEDGIMRVMLPGERPRLRAPSTHAPSDVPAAVSEAIAGIVALLRGERRDLRAVVLDERGIEPFDRRVYAAARQVGPGTTASYGDIARAIGEPTQAREVGVALARNRCPIIVPCHRVLSASGALHGFSAPGGLATKRRMLQIEGAPGFTQQALFA